MTSQSEAKVVSLFNKCVDRKSWGERQYITLRHVYGLLKSKGHYGSLKWLSLLVCLFVLGIYMPLLLGK